MRRVIVGVAAFVAALLFGMSPAYADTASWTDTYGSNGLYIQGHYLNRGPSPEVRADGMSGYISTGHGYLRHVRIREAPSAGAYIGTRDVYYSGTATSVTILNTPTTYLPWMANNGGELMTVQMWTSTGENIAFAWAL
jgi:hypothetical protein